MSKVKVCPIFGTGGILPRNVLPSIQNILEYHIHLNSGLTIKQVTDEVLNCWKEKGIPTVSVQTVNYHLLKVRKEFRSVLKNVRHWRHKYDVDRYKVKYSNLFDIAKCVCVRECSCVGSDRLPQKLFEFLQDQRTTKVMKFSSGMKGEPNSDGGDKLLKNDMIDSTDEIDIYEDNDTDDESDSDDEMDTDDDELWEPDAKKEKKNFKLKATAIVCDRYGFGNRSAAALATAVLEDFKIVTPSDKRFVIDHHKLKRARQSNRERLCLHSKVTSYNGLFFDGRKDRTLRTTVKDNMRYTKIVKEEHISLLAEPGGKYLGHVAPTKSSSENVTGEIFSFLNKENVNDDLQAVGTDATNVNTGWKGGIIQAIEKGLALPLQWLICLLHLNELPLRHLFRRLDGPTSGPRAFKGPIGKQLKNAKNLIVVKFKKIPCKLPTLPKDLSTDQKYLYNMCLAISTGQCSSNLAMTNPGNICHSRWLTTANNILRLYIGTAKPSKNLIILVKYILTVYAPVWFSIKINSKCYNGATNLYKLISLIRYLPAYLKKVVDPVLRRNAYFAHPENILIAMLCDDDPDVRNLAVERILSARATAKGKKPRAFRVPEINLNAKNYIEMIEWNGIQITEPPLTSKMSEADLCSIHENKKQIPSFNLPCHTQAVERCVKLVTEASMKVAGPDSRDGFIRATLFSRSQMSEFGTKNHYVTHNDKFC